jgi:hypothetical protein
MSTELANLHSHSNKAVGLTSFAGGTERGACIQFTQSAIHSPEFGLGQAGGFNTVQLTKEQVVEAMKVMTDWLADH